MGPFLPRAVLQLHANNRSADWQARSTWLVLHQRARLRARSQVHVFIGAVNSSRNPVTLSPPRHHCLRLCSCLFPVGDTRAQNTGPLLHRKHPKDLTIALFLVPPRNFSPDDPLFPCPRLLFPLVNRRKLGRKFSSDSRPKFWKISSLFRIFHILAQFSYRLVH